jgi:endonuclease G
MKKSIYAGIAIVAIAIVGIAATSSNEIKSDKKDDRKKINCYGKTPIDWDASPLTQKQITASLKNNFSFESDDTKDFYIYNGYVLKYNPKRRSALWTTHTIPYKRVRSKDENGNKIESALDRGEYCLEFKQDPNRNSLEKQAHHNDYIGTGFDKGHITPAGDFRNDSTGMLETFFITNMSAQSPDYNQIVMVDMENRIRSWVRKSKQDCQVITGAVYAAKKGRGFGPRKTAVHYPNAHYKVMYAEMNGKHQLYCFLVPHMFAYGDYELSDFQVSLDELEKVAGEDFLDKLDDATENDIESKKMDLKNF